MCGSLHGSHIHSQNEGTASLDFAALGLVFVSRTMSKSKDHMFLRTDFRSFPRSSEIPCLCMLIMTGLHVTWIMGTSPQLCQRERRVYLLRWGLCSSKLNRIIRRQDFSEYHYYFNICSFLSYYTNPSNMFQVT